MANIQYGKTLFRVQKLASGFAVNTTAPRKGRRGTNDHEVFKVAKPGAAVHAHGVELWADQAHIVLSNLLAAYEQVWKATAPATAIPIEEDSAFKDARMLLDIEQKSWNVIKAQGPQFGRAA